MDAQLKRHMRIMLIAVAIVFGAIFIYKFIMKQLMNHYMKNQSQVITVSSMKVGASIWRSELKAVGSVRALQGVNVTTELPGMVQEIVFKPGAIVEKGAVLVKLNADTDIAKLASLQAQLELANITLKRNQAQFNAKAISKEIVDTNIANVKNLQAQVDEQKAVVEKKIIKAPFKGHLGISTVDLGQYVNPGDKITTLQQLDTVYVDFNMPQQSLSQMKVGQTVSINSDTYPEKIFKGKITTIDPLVDVNTRNVLAEATVENPKLELIPGMFANVKIDTGNDKKYITLPQTAVSFNPYGSLVFLISHEKNKEDKDALIVNQTFILTGETRGDQVAVLKGLKEGEEVVTSGQLKLKNGSGIAINNSIVPDDSVRLNLPNEH